MITSTALTFDSLIHLQDSQTISCVTSNTSGFDSLIHLQDSQTKCYNTF